MNEYTVAVETIDGPVYLRFTAPDEDTMWAMYKLAVEAHSPQMTSARASVVFTLPWL